MTPYQKAKARLESLGVRHERGYMTDNRYASSGRMDTAIKALTAARYTVAVLVHGERLYTLRKRLGLSQKAMGEWINPDVKDMSRQVRRWERGERVIPGTVKVLLRLFDRGIIP